MNPKIRLLISDDGLALIESLKYILSLQKETFEVVSIANNKEYTLEYLKDGDYNMLLLDLSFNQSTYDGSDIARIVKNDFPNVKIVIFTNNVKLFIFNELIDNIKVDGIIDKESSLDTTINGLKIIHNGSTFIDESVKHTLQKSPFSKLTKSELNVLHHTSNGMIAKELSELRNTSVNTIRNQITQMGIKMGMNTKQLIAFYSQYQISARENFNETIAPFQKKAPK